MLRCTTPADGGMRNSCVLQVGGFKMAPGGKSKGPPPAVKKARGRGGAARREWQDHILTHGILHFDKSPVCRPRSAVARRC